jgi:hypothetical protein
MEEKPLLANVLRDVKQAPVEAAASGVERTMRARRGAQKSWRRNRARAVTDSCT